MQCVESAAQFLIIAYCKMQQEKDTLKKELLSKKELALDGLEYIQPIQTAKDEIG